MEQSDVIVTVHDIDQYTEDNTKLDQRLNELKSQQADKEAQQAQVNQLLQSSAVNVSKLILILKN